MTPAMTPEALEAAGLWRSADPDSIERLELLQFLLADGVDVEALAAANRAGRLVQASTLAMVTVPVTLSCCAMAERTGLAPEVVARVWRSSGFPVPSLDVALFSEDDVSVFESFATGASQFGVEATLQWTRVLGSGLTRVAEASVSLFSSKVAAHLDATHAAPVVAAKASADATRLLLGVPDSVVAPLFRHYAMAAVERHQATREPGSFDLQRLAVGIVDLVDFTPLSAELSPQQLAVALDDLETAASDAVTSTASAVIVKYLGDALVYVAGDAREACRVAFELAAHIEAHPVLTALRGGIAYGDVLALSGDYFGPPVNLAARATELADPGTVVVTAAVIEAAGGAIGVEPLGARPVKGFPEPIELFRLTSPA